MADSDPWQSSGLSWGKNTTGISPFLRLSQNYLYKRIYLLNFVLLGPFDSVIMINWMQLVKALS